MFTGIVEELGVVIERDGGRFRFGASVVVEDAKVGDSIAVNGCCLTVVDIGPGRRSLAKEGIRGPAPLGDGPTWWEADAVEETLRRTNLDDLGPGDRVNLERPLRAGDRLGGHIVQGHVDAVGEVVEPAPNLRVRMPGDLARYVVEKGSITVDGCSLTVVDALDDGFTVAIIPHTSAVTTLGGRKPGERVNLEVDLVAKYVERLVAFTAPKEP